MELGVNLEDQHGPAAEWVAQEPNQRAIAKKFKNFLFSYGVDGNERIYWHRLRAVCRSAHPTPDGHKHFLLTSVRLPHGNRDRVLFVLNTWHGTS